MRIFLLAAAALVLLAARPAPPPRLLVAGDGIDGTFGVLDPAPPFAPLADWFAPALAYDAASGLLYYPHNGFGDSGVHVFDAATGERLTDRAAPAQTPSDLLLVP